MEKTGVPTFLKWAGGKTRLLEQYSPLLPTEISTYIEPFLGSGSMLFNILKKYGPKKTTAMDINSQLIDCFKVVQNFPKRLIKSLEIHRSNHNEKYYYYVRSLKPEELSNMEKAARFIYLNKTCWNGLYRVNSKEEFNVPIGRYNNPMIFNRNKILEASRLIKKTKFKCCSFEHVLTFAKPGDFVYCDPPYHPLNATSSFTSYHSTGFNLDKHLILKNVFEKLHMNHCKVMLSNSDTYFIRKLYNNYKITKVVANRFLNCDATHRGKIVELVIKNY